MLVEPRASYRLQLRPGFGFDEAAALTGYFAELGISHLYLSPCLKAVRGSTHGYDIVDYHRVNDELGGEQGHERLCATLAAHGLSQIVDMVPNHMAISGPENPWWWDVLENGPSSRYASYFDVDWDPPEAKLRHTLLMPVLGDHYGRVLEAGELKLRRRGGSFIIVYHERAFPVSPRSLDTVLSEAARRSGSERLGFIADALGALPGSTAADAEAFARRHRDKEVLRAALARLFEEEPEIGRAVDSVVAEINSDSDALDALLERQNYRLAFWRTARRDLGYRRFFDISSLVGLRMEDERVFADTHVLPLAWLGEKRVDGLRLDHVDGLRDPEAYLKRLRQRCPGAWFVVEKILGPDEHLPESWGVAGTTGYDFLNRVSGLFVDPGGEEPLTSFFAEFTGESTDYAALGREKKHLVMHDLLGSDVNRLTAVFLDICERHRRHRDYTRHELHEALRAVIARFPVYRTYVRAEVGAVRDEDRRHIAQAVEAARLDRPDLDAKLFGFLEDLLVLRVGGKLESELVMRFQQLTPSVMAKGVEDTAFYCFNRLVALNEVGGDPGRFGCTVEEFHAACQETQRREPLTMLETSSHDTKRSEDVRARLCLLSEIAGQWAAAVRNWSAINQRYWRGVAPDRNAEYLFYQTLVGAWPIGLERVASFMEKAAREAKVHTSWTNPDPIYESMLGWFIEGSLGNYDFNRSLKAFVEPLVEPGRINSLAQTLIKLTAPGIPDLYQGSELWGLGLVDPDNRRPVDYEVRRRLLADLRTATVEEIVRRSEEGMSKLWVIRQALGLRRRRPDLFGPAASYRPLLAGGSRAAHVVAFVRGAGAVTVTPRLVMGVGKDWAGTRLELPGSGWRNELTGEELGGETVPLARLFARFPVALLARPEGRK